MNWDDWVPAGEPRTSDDRLRGYRYGQHNGVYGPMVPLHLQMERAMDRWKKQMEAAYLYPNPIIVHPEIFKRWVSEGWITEDGNWKWPR